MQFIGAFAGLAMLICAAVLFLGLGLGVYGLSEGFAGGAVCAALGLVAWRLLGDD